MMDGRKISTFLSGGSINVRLILFGEKIINQRAIHGIAMQVGLL